MTTFLELVKSRYSVRRFKMQPIEQETLNRVLEAARIAPTAHNNQPQRIKVISGDDLRKVDMCTQCRFGAPTVLMVCYDKNVCWKREFDDAPSGEVDASIVTTHMMLTAHDEGLGTCWVMYFNTAKAIELFNLPDNIVPIALLPIGYPSDDVRPSSAHSQRFALEQLLFQ